MSAIHSKSDLLQWLADQLREAQPQGPVLAGMVHVFNDLVEIFGEIGRFDLSHADWFDYLDEVFGMINRFPSQRTCSTRVPAFLTTIYGEALTTDEPVSCDRAIEILIRMLGFEHGFRRKRGEGGRTFLVTTRAFREEHGVKVRVLLTERATRPKRREFADPPLFQI